MLIGRIVNGDCLEKMKELREDSIDLIATDPPYGYSFMNKEWDRGVPKVEVWKECLRILKPGAFAFIMSAPRQDVQCQMIMNLKEAGFEMAFTPLYWAYASGFPKAMNISKAVDKRNGRNSDEYLKLGKYLKEMRGDKPQKEISKSKSTTPQAKALDGSYAGFQPKPAVEIILVAMKPLSEKTYVDQAMSNGKGITWLDDCRVPTREKTQDCGAKTINSEVSRIQGDKEAVSGICPADLGRFPANLLVSDDVLNDGKEHSVSGSAKLGKYHTQGLMRSGFIKGLPRNKNISPNDSGSFSRYFSLDVWAKKLPKEAQKTFPFLIVPKASKSEKNKGLESSEEKTQRKNTHPTTKPLKLMQYLITLGSREGDTVLDPFLGSGTTAIAAQVLGRDWVGIELNEEYCKIAESRIIPYLLEEKNEN